MVCFDQYELDFLGQIKFLYVEMPCRRYFWVHVRYFSLSEIGTRVRFGLELGLGPRQVPVKVRA